ncbi:hypothetical protein LTR53_000163 [Teratosphaeriaceae sp. CCFEE 6253]|nr:hypothetical protein LTR53_000163 [Teratosphaeriaceae sp. CCFEE 6253]
MAKAKQFTRTAKVPRSRSVGPHTADEFQDAADSEEDRAGKWRLGDPAKSGRAFVRALEIYDGGLQKHPSNFDLAYNKARLELEISQRPVLVAHVGLPLIDWLKQTLESHRYALRLNEQNPEALFNTSQVLTSLAEQLSEAGDASTAVPLLQEALELLSACCSRQEMLLEQQQADFGDADEGEISLDSEEPLSPATGLEEGEQMATIESPVTASDLLDTMHASLSALTTLVAIVEHHALDTLGDMAQSLTESRAPVYVGMLPEDAMTAARFALALDRANFVAAFADAQFTAGMIEIETYLTRLDGVFSIPNKDEDTVALSSEAEARTELVLSAITRHGNAMELAADMCWKQLKLAQECYTKMSKLEPSAQLYLARGDVEMLRHRIAIQPDAKLADSVRKSAPTLAQNAQTYYKGSIRLATDEDENVRSKALRRLDVSGCVRALVHGVGTTEPPNQEMLHQALAECVEEGLMDVSLAEGIASKA